MLIEQTKAHELISCERLRIGWWNTSLSPVGCERSGETERDIASQVVQTLMDVIGVDFLALGEINHSDLIRLRDSCVCTTLSIYDGTLKEGRIQFDTGVIYNRERLELLHGSAITINHGNRSYKLANLITFLVKSDKTVLHILITHWPSRGVTEENLPARRVLAVRLGDKVKELKEMLGRPSVIVMGDFNDEPFDESIATCLLATRDRRLALRDGYLYNPFWRSLGESEPHSFSSKSKSIGGSYFHRGGRDTKWRTFDQILFSSTFLEDGPWHLNERETMIFRTESLIDLIQDSSTHFDHLPVLASIERHIQE